MSGIVHHDQSSEIRLQHGNGGPPLADRRALVAVDLGAESCRVSLLRWREKDGLPEITVVHRFANGPIQEGASLRWHIKEICAGVEEGLRKCAAIANEGIASLGVDGWAVDYVRLDSAGNPVANPFCYRDERTSAAVEEVHRHISAARLYHLTGTQILPLNTLYQLWADKTPGPQERARWINLPEYVLFRLGGKRVSEFTNATQTQMLGVRDQKWNREIFAAVGLDIDAAPPVVQPGTDIGRITGPLAALPALHDTRLIAPACHDTASAIAGIPAQGGDWAFVSSGTWSLVGCVLDAPNISDEARKMNFSNEGGVGGKIYFLKNVNGMWLLRQCMQAWQSENTSWTLDTLLDACASQPAPEVLLDVDDPDLLLPDKMPSRINAQLIRAGAARIAEQAAAAPVMANLIFHSLAARYAAVLRDAARITGNTFTRLYIAGGGSKNTLLNRLTARATGLTVVSGPAESATMGNFAVQLAALAGKYTEQAGVTSSPVAEFAKLLVETSVVSVARAPSSAGQPKRINSRSETERASG